MIFRSRLRTLSLYFDGVLGKAAARKVAARLDGAPEDRKTLELFEAMDTATAPTRPLAADFTQKLLAGLPAVERTSQPDCGEILSAQGMVRLGRNGDEGAPVFPGTIIRRGDRLCVGPGALALVELSDGSTLYLNRETELEFYPGTYALALSGGEIFAMMRRQREVFEIKTPAAVLGVVGTDFDVRVTGEQRTVLTVAQGKVSFRNDIDRTVVGRNKRIEASRFEPPKPQRVKRAWSAAAWTELIQTKRVKRNRIMRKLKMALLIVAIIVAAGYAANSLWKSSHSFFAAAQPPRPNGPGNLAEPAAVQLKDKLFPPPVYAFASQKLSEVIDQLPAAKGTGGCQHLVRVDANLKVSMGASFGSKYPAGEIQDGEMHMGMTDKGDNLAIFDEDGKLLKSRLTPNKQNSSKDDIYLKLGKPWQPGEVRSFFALSANSPGVKKISEQDYALTMQNHPSADVQQFCLVLDPGLALADSSEPPLDSQTLDGLAVYFWSKQVTPKENCRVDVTLRRE